MARSVLEPCGTLGMKGDLSLLPGVVGNVVGVSFPPTVVTRWSVLVCFSLHDHIHNCTLQATHFDSLNACAYLRVYHDVPPSQAVTL